MDSARVSERQGANFVDGIRLTGGEASARCDLDQLLIFPHVVENIIQCRIRYGSFLSENCAMRQAKRSREDPPSPIGNEYGRVLSSTPGRSDPTAMSQIPGTVRIPYARVLGQAADGDAAEDVHAVQRCGRGEGRGRGRWRDQAGGGRGHEDEVSGGTARASAERSREYPCFSYL